MKRFFDYISIATFLVVFLLVPSLVSASGIDSLNRFAWSETVGWIDFGTTLGAVTISDTALSGYAFGENIGWINLGTVVNNGTGVLSGKAWSETVGWIDFKPAQGGVTISSSGVFSGYAFGENIGWINFDTSKPVTTDWRQASNSSSASGDTKNSRSGSASGRRKNVNMEFLTPTISPTKNIPPVPPISSPISSTPSIFFDKSITVGSNSSQVRSLQILLNSLGFVISQNGPGSPGNETTSFGSLTKQALQKFQCERKIICSGAPSTTGYGKLGPKTREAINKLIKN